MSGARDFASALHVLHRESDRAIAWRLALAAVLLVAGSVLSGLAPLALSHLVDAVAVAAARASHANLTLATMAGVTYLAALCGARLLSELRPSLIGTAEQRLYARVRRRFFAHVLDLPMRFHLGRRTGALVHGLEQAVTGYQIVVFHLTNSVVPVVVELATVSLVLASLDQPALMAAFAATALAYLMVIGLLGLRLESVARGVAQANLDMHGMLADALLNCETIKCFGAEPGARLRFAKTSGATENLWMQLHRERSVYGLTLAMTFAVSITTALALSIRAMSHGGLTVGGFVMATACFLQLVRPLELLGGATRDMSQALAFVRPLLAVFRETPEPPTQSAATGPLDHARKPRISYRNVTFGYDCGKPVLQDLTLAIESGRSVAIVGASGSGKSSLIRLLLRLYEPQAGCILLDDDDIATLPLGEVRATVGLVPQDIVLFNDTMAFNIGIARPGATQDDIRQAARVAQLHNFIASLPRGYDTVVGERGLRLSGGERQRIAIARVVLMNPSIYVFDEATSMLDSLTEQAILRNLREISVGSTTITIAHRLSTARLAEEIVVLAGGCVVERGNHHALLARGGAYADLWNAQLQGSSAPHS